MPESLISNPILNSLALTLLHFVWQGVLVALVLKSVLMITSTQKAQLRYGFASLAMLANLLLPIATFFVIYTPEYLQIASQLQIMPLVNAGFSLNQHNGSVWHSNLIELFPYISILWITVVGFLSCKLLLELYAVNQLPKSNFILADKTLTARFGRLVSQINLKKSPELIISLKTDVPMAIGWLKPVVLIPASMLTGLTPVQLDMLILHELAHIRRHDYLVNFIQTLVELLLFFHPAVQWVSNQMRNEREYCSDDIAVKNCGNAIAYAHTLADTATLCNKHRNHSIPNMAMAASGGDLKQRVIRLIDQHHCSNSNNASKWLASAAIVLSILFVSSKQLLTLPQIDFTSGSISLLKSSSNNLFEDFNSVTENLSQTSLALELLEQDKNNSSAKQGTQVSAKHHVADEKITETTNVPRPAYIKKDIATKQVNIADNVELEVVEKTITAGSEKTMVSNPVNLAPARSAATKEKSISELAIERTDSTSKQSVISNPYTEQIASLSIEPSLTGNHKVFEKEAWPFQTRLTSLEQQKPVVKESVIPKKVEEAQLISSIEPRYPATAKRKGIEMEVMVDFIIDKKGNVKDIQLAARGKVNYFRSAIRSAVEKWRFSPAKVDGKAIDSKMSKIFSFTLIK